jgi:hypothetical protein
MTCRVVRLCLAVVLWSLPTLRSHAAEAPANPPGTDFQQELFKQQQIKTTTKRVGDQLESVIAEFDRNGISGEDVKVLRAIRSVLDKLSEKDMAMVLEYLQQSRSASDPAVAARNATDAFAGQKAIVVQLQQLVLEYQRQQALYEISLRLKELASRQSANMWLGVGLAKSAEGKTSFSSFDENQKISLRYQQSEQNPLKDETAAILAKLSRLSAETTDGPAAERSKVALQQAKDGGLTPALEAAAQELKEDKLKLLSAIGNEKKARDQLREIARLLILSQDTADALKQAILELDRAIDSQKKVTADTQQTKKKDDADKRATDQAIVVDDTDLIRKDIDSLAPIAAEHLRTATDKMQEARGNLSSNEEAKKRVELAVPRQEEALLQMQTARRALEEQLARAEELKEKPENVLAALKELQEQVRELIKNQESLKQETASAERKQLPARAPKQGELKDKAQELQARAASPSPEAAQSIGEASSQMQKSQNSLAQEQNNSPAQQAALDALQRADQQLAKDIAELEQAQKDLAQIEEMLKKLVAIIEEQQSAQFATARQTTRPMPEIEAMKTLSTRQDALATNTAALQQESKALVPAASSHLGSAREHMVEARAELDKSAPRPAEPKQREALTELYLAKKEFENKINELRDKLGLPPAQDTDALAEAQKRIEEAQKQVSDAQQQLQQAPPGLMEALQKQQQEIASALNELRQDAKNPKAVAPAEQAASEAARQLAQSDLPKAIDSMKAAQSAMQQAQQQNGQPAQQGKGSPSLAELGKQQAEVQKAAEALMAAQQKAPASAMQAAAEALQQANDAISPITAGALGQMPAGAQSALQSAQGSTAQGSAQAQAGQGSPAQQSAAAAAQALAQAQAALALAQAGVGSEAAMGQQGEGKGQGQGKGKGQGQGQGQAQANAQGRGKGQPSPQGNGNVGNWDGSGGADGPRQGTAGSSSFTRLPNRDRAALQQSQAEKYPQEYGPLVEQYLRNLSDQATDK